METSVSNSKKQNVITIVILHVMFFLYSISGILTKLAASESFFSIRFCLYYCGIIFIFGLYAIGWQQVIKRIPLTTAFSNKAVTVIWGIIWGYAFFGEAVSFGKILGAGLVMAGIVLYSISGTNE